MSRRWSAPAAVKENPDVLFKVNLQKAIRDARITEKSFLVIIPKEIEPECGSLSTGFNRKRKCTLVLIRESGKYMRANSLSCPICRNFFDKGSLEVQIGEGTPDSYFEIRVTIFPCENSEYHALLCHYCGHEFVITQVVAVEVSGIPAVRTSVSGLEL